MKLENKIPGIFSETENYLQRFGPFLVSNETDDTGSKLQTSFEMIRGILRDVDRILKSNKNVNEIHLKLKISVQQIDAKEIYVSLRINEDNISFGSLSELDGLIENMKGYYERNLNTNNLFRAENDDLLRKRTEFKFPVRLNSRQSSFWKLRLLENARTRLDEFFAGPQVWKCLKDGQWDSLHQFKDKHNGDNPILGISAAWCNLGMIYWERSYRPQEAKALIRKAAEEGNVIAMRQVVLTNLSNTIEDWEKMDKKIDQWNKRERKFFSEVKKYLEKMIKYLKNGTDQETEDQTKEWLRKYLKDLKQEANQGDEIDRGYEIEENPEKYLVYIRKLLREGDTQTQTKLGVMYRRASKLVPEIETGCAGRAIDWIEQSCEKGNDPIPFIRAAWHNLVLTYWKCRYWPREAKAIIRKLAEEGNVIAMRQVVLTNLSNTIEDWKKINKKIDQWNKRERKFFSEVEKYLEKMIKYLKNGIDQETEDQIKKWLRKYLKDLKQETNQGDEIYREYEIEENPEKYLMYLKKLLRASDTQTQTKLGVMYRSACELVREKDQIVPQALYWFEQASDKGNSIEATINICEMAEIDSLYDTRNRTDNKYDSYLEKCRSTSGDSGCSASEDLSARASYLLARAKRRSSDVCTEGF